MEHHQYLLHPLARHQQHRTPHHTAPAHTTTTGRAHTMTTSTKQPTRAEQEAQHRDEYLDHLRELVPTGSTVYTIVRSVSRSGLSRRMDFYVVSPADTREDGTPKHIDLTHPRARPYLSRITYSMREAGILSGSLDGGARVNGCGMDMAFATVYNLGQALYGDGYALRSSVL